MSAVQLMHHAQKQWVGAQKWVGGKMHNQRSNHGRLVEREKGAERHDGHNVAHERPDAGLFLRHNRLKFQFDCKEVVRDGQLGPHCAHFY